MSDDLSSDKVRQLLNDFEQKNLNNYNFRL